MNHTKLTVLVPEDLHQRAKAAAALRGDNLSEIVRDALKEYIEESEDIAFVDEIEKRLDEGEETLHPIEEVWARLDALPDQPE
jgi:predicted DNA-binding protein